MPPEIAKTKDEPYASLRFKLLEPILSGKFAAGERFYSVREVAQWPGATVHLAQRALQDICKEGFLESVPKKGLFVSEVGRRSRPTKAPVSWQVLLLLVNPDSDRIRLEEMLPAVAGGFDPSQWRIEVVYLKDDYLNDGGFRCSESIISRHPSAVLWFMPKPSNMLLVRHIVSTGIPVVTYNRDFTATGACSVICDVSDVAKELFLAVWNTGKRRIAVLSIDRWSPSIQQFPEAVLEAARNIGASDKVRHILLPLEEPENIHSINERMFAAVDELMSLPDAPDGIVCAESFSLKCVELWLSQHPSVRVPADLAIASFDRQLDHHVVRVLPSIPSGDMDHRTMIHEAYLMIESERAGRRAELKPKKVPAKLYFP